jgi:hypothetical protein
MKPWDKRVRERAMDRMRRSCRMILAGLGMAMMPLLAHAGSFTPPTPEELALKAVPGYPGAAAVVLYREQITMDDMHSVQHYDRVKILTEEGKKYANIELKYVSLNDYGDNNYTDDKALGNIEGRTIHADGTIIPFTGKPYVKTLESSKHVKYRAMVFTLPDVEVGSIIEYRYSTWYDDHAYEAPQWLIQGDLYVKAAHYEWYPTIQQLVDGKDRPINSVSWFPILPPGAQIDRSEHIAPKTSERIHTYFLDVKDVPPIVDEEYEPPIHSYSYRVLFNFTPFRSSDDYWKNEGKDWSKRVDSFASVNSSLREATDKVTAGATTDDQKLRLIYAAVMKLENTNFTREHDQREDKAAGEKTKNAADILAAGRGTPTQITELFIDMARAAGLKAYAMYVPDRSIEFFTPSWLSFEQFDQVIAIVNVDGKEMSFDPGERYMPYGHLAWQHTLISGLRQSEKGTEIGQTGTDDYKQNRVTRVANLDMDEKGQITGKVDITYYGADALHWRQTALRGDDESFKHALKESLEQQVPKSLDVTVSNVAQLDDYEKPLMITYTVSGSLGTPTGKRLVMPVDLFLSGETATFPHEKRDLPVYFHYPSSLQDALRINFKKGFSIEAVPPDARYTFADLGLYNLKVEASATSFTTQRVQLQGGVIVMPKDYGTLRNFYSQMESKDQESVNQ